MAKKALICGSVAFDTIMVFGDRFKNHILPDKIHMLNVSFLVPEMRREFGGCAANIAYGLHLLGDRGIAIGVRHRRRKLGALRFPVAGAALYVSRKFAIAFAIVMAPYVDSPRLISRNCAPAMERQSTQLCFANQ